MRRLVLQMQMSVDGYVAAADPDLVWQVWDWGDHWIWDDQLADDFNAVFRSIDCILLSRKIAQEGFLDHWTAAAKKFPADPRYAFAQKIVETNKVVVTDKLEKAKWDRTIVARGGLVEEVTALKRQPGQNIIAFGGVGFAAALVAAGLVDEFQFFVNPTAVGDGRSLFDDRAGTKLRLIRSTAYACGIVVNSYVPAAAPHDPPVPPER
jgi:dihydrofolate reductase